jgi:acetolactate synthase-1/2/3 large subunit
MHDLTGAELLGKCLAINAIRYIFTVRTPRLEPILKAIADQGVITVVEARNETAATLMADGYIRRAGQHAATLTDDNGRAISQICGVTNAWADKVPLISISLCSDALPDQNKGYDRYRYDQNSAFAPVIRWHKRVASLNDLAVDIGTGIAESSRHKMGPVHIDIPAGLLNELIPAAHVAFPASSVFSDTKINPTRLTGDEDAVRRAALLLRQARKPLIFCGGGVIISDAGAEVLRFVEEFKIPAATTMAGIGAISADHPYCIGGPSYIAGEAFHVAIKEADVVLAVGVSFGGLEGFGLPPLWSADIKFIHIDIDPLQIGLNVNPEVAILGDARTVLAQFKETMHNLDFQGNSTWEAWRTYLQRLKQSRRQRLHEHANQTYPKLHQGKLAEAIGAFVKQDDLLIVVDGGNTALYASMYGHGMVPRQTFFPYGMAALGVGIPYAIGVQLAAPDKRVVLLTGDGSFLYNVQELETICRLKLPIVIIVNNDSAWNMIKAAQDFFMARRHVGSVLPDLDYARIAQGFGLHVQRVFRPDEIGPAYASAMSCGSAALIDCVTDPQNLPDCLMSFALVEFEGVLGHLSPLKTLKSLCLMKDIGMGRMIYHLAFLIKALLRINPGAKRSIS